MKYLLKIHVLLKFYFWVEDSLVHEDSRFILVAFAVNRLEFNRVGPILLDVPDAITVVVDDDDDDDEVLSGFSVKSGTGNIS
jgi:hypothetical protein